MTSASFTKSPSPVAGNLTMRGVLRSEWTKFRSLRSTWWLLSTAVILTVGVAVIATPGAVSGTHRGSWPSAVAWWSAAMAR